MTTSRNPEPSAEAKAESQPLGPSAGKLLREARLKAGVHLAVLSVTLKVPVRELEALEADVLDMAKGPVFYRGLASSVCRHLRVDPAEILALLPPTAARLSPVHKLASAAVSASDFHLDSPSSAKLSVSKVFLGAFLMLVLTAALLWMPSPMQWTWVGQLQSLWSADAPSEPRNFSVTDDLPLRASQSGDAQSRQSMDEGENQASVNFSSVSNGLATLSAPDVVLPAAVPAPASPGAQAATSAPEWVFTSVDDSWLEVRNAQRAIVWSGMVKPGSSVRVQSPLPVSVVVGRAQVVTVSFRGQPFDLKPHTQVAVARFEVKE